MSASPSVLLGVAVALAIGGGCGGQSEASKANDDVCSAKADIQKQVTSLQGMTGVHDHRRRRDERPEGDPD